MTIHYTRDLACAKCGAAHPGSCRTNESLGWQCPRCLNWNGWLSRAPVPPSEREQARVGATEALARAADAYVWNPTDETMEALRNARGEWQSATGMAKLAASAPPSDETVDALEKQLLRDVVAWYSKPRQVLAAEDRVRSLAALARTAADRQAQLSELVRAATFLRERAVAAEQRAAELRAENETLRAWEGKPPVSWREETFRLRLQAAVAERDRLRLELDETGECRRLCSPEAEQRAAELETEIEAASRQLFREGYVALSRRLDDLLDRALAARSREQQDTAGGQA